MFDAIKRKIIKDKAKEFLGNNIEIVDQKENVLVKIKHKKFFVKIQGIDVVFEVEEEEEVDQS